MKFKFTPVNVLLIVLQGVAALSYVFKPIPGWPVWAYMVPAAILVLPVAIEVVWVVLQILWALLLILVAGLISLFAIPFVGLDGVAKWWREVNESRRRDERAKKIRSILSSLK